MAKPKKVNFTALSGILDVTKGREKLAAYLHSNPALPVIIYAVITDPYGRDDGISIEFNFDVTRVEHAVGGHK